MNEHYTTKICRKIASQTEESPSLYSESMRFLSAPFHRVSLLEVMKNANKAARKLMLAKVRIKPTSNAATHTKKHSDRNTVFITIKHFPRKLFSYSCKARSLLDLH